MTQDRMAELFFELFSGLPRQGPGDAASTLRALAAVPHLGPTARVLDIGCGTGTQTLVLARNSPARFLAIDNHPLFVEELNRRAAALGMADRVQARVGDMRHVDFDPGSFDLIWSEGAINVVGFESGLRAWQSLLAPGGHLAVTEACWSRPNPPPECAAFWEQEYPAIRDVPAFLALIAECGYETVSHFALPSSSWWDDYYRPLQQNIVQFRERHRDEGDAQHLADHVQREIDIWHAYGEFYSYEFFVLRARSPL
jgi:cyclopropane fatty-acyl-phospholipid synthase-like methyltransferase